MGDIKNHFSYGFIIFLKLLDLQSYLILIMFSFYRET